MSDLEVVRGPIRREMLEQEIQRLESGEIDGDGLVDWYLQCIWGYENGALENAIDRAIFQWDSQGDGYPDMDDRQFAAALRKALEA